MHKHTPTIRENRMYSRCRCGTAMRYVTRNVIPNVGRTGYWRCDTSVHARILAGPVWEYPETVKYLNTWRMD